MQELISALKNADDDYLIGLSNKGIVKRAYKDLEQLELSAEYEEHTAKVNVSEETCTIVSPLGDSKCTCPSRSVCRHMIAAILWLKKSGLCSQDEKDTNEAVGKEIPSVEVSNEAEGKEILSMEVSNEAEGKEITIVEISKEAAGKVGVFEETERKEIPAIGGSQEEQ